MWGNNDWQPVIVQLTMPAVDDNSDVTNVTIGTSLFSIFITREYVGLRCERRCTKYQSFLLYKVKYCSLFYCRYNTTKMSCYNRVWALVFRLCCLTKASVNNLHITLRASHVGQCELFTSAFVRQQSLNTRSHTLKHILVNKISGYIIVKRYCRLILH